MFHFRLNCSDDRKKRIHQRVGVLLRRRCLVYLRRIGRLGEECSTLAVDIVKGRRWNMSP